MRNVDLEGVRRVEGCGERAAKRGAPAEGTGIGGGAAAAGGSREEAQGDIGQPGGRHWAEAGRV